MHLNAIKARAHILLIKFERDKQIKQQPLKQVNGRCITQSKTNQQ